MVQVESWLLLTVLWPPHTCCGVCVWYIYTQAIFLNYKNNSARIKASRKKPVFFKERRQVEGRPPESLVLFSLLSTDAEILKPDAALLQNWKESQMLKSGSLTTSLASGRTIRKNCPDTLPHISAAQLGKVPPVPTKEKAKMELHGCVLSVPLLISFIVTVLALSR